MSSILLNLLDQRLCLRLTQTLLHLFWEGTVIGLCAFAMVRICRTATARMRYGIHAVALALMALCIPVTFAWIDPAGSPPGEPVVVSGIGSTRSTATTASERNAFGAPGLDPRAPFVDAAATNESRLFDWVRRASPYATGAYLFGVLAMLARLIFALWGSHRLRRCAVAIGDQELLSQIRLQARRIGLKVIPIVAYCERITIPVVVGILRPMILLPLGVTAELDAEQLLVILAHEMAHIRRFDLLVNVLQRLLETVLFFHPAAWYVSRQLTMERENCCDDAVVQAGNETTRYASALVRMAELCVSRRRPVRATQLAALAAGGSNGTQLKFRILRLLDGERSPRLMRADALALIVTVALIAGTMAGAWRHAVAEQADRPGQHQKITAISPQVQAVTISERYVGQIHAQRHIKVRALQKGYLEDVPVKEGQMVKQGDLMFRVKPILYQAKLDAELAEVKRAQLEFNSKKKLYDKKVISEDELALCETPLAKAKANAQLAAAELDFTAVKAPFDGIVGRLNYQQGGLVDSGEAVTILSDNSQIWVYFNVPEAHYFQYMADPNKDDLKIELVLANGKKFEPVGKIGAIDADFNNENGSIPFRADFPNPNRLLRHGQTGTIVISHVVNGALVIPQRATFEVLQKRYVYVIDKEDVAHLREIVIQNESDDIFVIKKGLDVNDKIVLDGIRQVHDGEKVEYE
jgi:membrane fusion protein (multidrug efflux system)